MHKRNLIIWITIALAIPCSGQTNRLDSAPDTVPPQEHIYIHYNNTLLFAGEYLYYKVYCLNAEDLSPSKISKIAYVELLSHDLSVVFRHKVRLQKGIGQGDFFISVSVPSGNYKLVGYTRWMRNESPTQLFSADVNLLNPYQSDQRNILESSDLNPAGNSEKSAESEERKPERPDSQKAFLTIETDKSHYGHREKVILKTDKVHPNLKNGSYSLSVFEKTFLPQAPHLSAGNNVAHHKNVPKNKVKSQVILPELRGEVLTGSLKVLTPDRSVANVNIAVSLPGHDYDLKIATTDDAGSFSVLLPDHYKGETAVIQVIGVERGGYRILMNDYETMVYPDLDFYQLRIGADMKSQIEERSVHNQIENRFFSAKPDSIDINTTWIPFYGLDVVTYDLDDYSSHFRTMEEVMVEIIADAWIETDASGKSVFKVRSLSYGEPEYWSPMVVADGILLQDHSSLIHYDPERIRRIKVSKGKHVLGKQIFEGLLIVETEEGDFPTREQEAYIIEHRLFRPEPQKRYFRQAYDRSDVSRAHIPDFRHQLIWIPDLLLKEEGSSVEFYTSDVKGTFQVILEGFTLGGEPVSASTSFTVE